VIDGCRTFSEIHDGVPRISPALLSTRLTELADAGLIKREKQRGSTRYIYATTEAGMALEGVINQLAIWGQHWARDMEMDDLDPGFLAWSMSLRINGELMPPGRTVLQFEFSGAPKDFQRFWLVNNDGIVDMCLKHPGFETDLMVRADLRRFVETWRGFRDLREEIKAAKINLTGSRELKKAFPDWLMLSMFAHVERKSSGRERRIAAHQTVKQAS